MNSFLELIRYAEWKAIFLPMAGRIVGALVLLLLGLWIARRLATLVRLGIERRGGDVVLAEFLRNFAFGAMVLVLLVGVLDLAGVPTTSLLAALGAAGLGIGLALKDSLSNLAAGVLLIVTRPFRSGDQIEVVGKIGVVSHIGLLQTVLTTPENAEVTLPNGQLITNPIVNYTSRGTRRLDLHVAINATGDPTVALDVIHRALEAEGIVVKEPKPQVLVTKLGDGTIDLSIRPFVKAADYWPAHTDVLRAVKVALETAQIPIAATRVMRMLPEPSKPAAPQEPGR